MNVRFLLVEEGKGQQVPTFAPNPAKAHTFAKTLLTMMMMVLVLFLLYGSSSCCDLSYRSKSCGQASVLLRRYGRNTARFCFLLRLFELLISKI